MDYNQLRKISIDFRRLSANMLKSKDEHNNSYLIRFRKFIEDTPIIKKAIEDRIKSIDYNYKESFIVDDYGWKSINIPVDEAEHIKAMYDYLIDITEEEINLVHIALKFRHSSKKRNDIIQSYLDKAFRPLVDFIVDYLSGEMIFMENKSSQINVTQHINNMNGTNNIAGGDISSINNVSTSSKEDIKQLIESTIKMMEEENIDEDVIDELVIIQEQINNEQPKEGRIRKACNALKEFISKSHSNIATITAIVTNLNLLIEKLKVFELLVG